MEIIPSSSGRLDQDAGFSVGNVDAPLDAGRLLQQRSLIDNARRRIGGTIRRKLLGLCRNRRGYDQQCHGDKEKMDPHKMRHDNQPFAPPQTWRQPKLWFRLGHPRDKR